MNAEGNETDGLGADLEETLIVIRNHPIFKQVINPELFFWKMFIIDALIGNPDRNNGNWGLLTKENSVIGFAPIYDNGNCLNNKWDDDKIAKCLSSEQAIENAAYKGVVCFFTNKDKRVNPFHIIASGKYLKCKVALDSLLDNIDVNAILNVFNESNISKVKNCFYSNLIKLRYEHLLNIQKELNEKQRLDVF